MQINIINMLYPKICGFCKQICKDNICPRCNYNLKHMEQKKIKKVEEKYYDELAFIFKYEGLIRERLIEYKFYEGAYLYKFFSDYIINNKKYANFINNYDIIIPVPVHKKREKKRGYNQTELIANKLAEELKIGVETNILIKEKNTKPQSTMNKENRVINAKNVYKIKNEERIYQKKVLLLDDIFTTGSTVEECSRMLKLANPSKIGVMVIAKD